ncbi:barttin [Spea bombifrons]|uniref:barttin n=1 Tax=Spea bombifrons TaxID=233779 RepID=UPI00234BFF80|nr:barttin [Spea bombifrons]
MAEDKTFRYGLIVLGFFLVMIGMFIMSVDRPHVYITFCAMGVFMVCIGITWSICQCYPKITFTPVDLETVALTEKVSEYKDNPTPEKQCSTTHYTTSKEAERYETSLPPYEQIHIKVEGPAEPKGDQSVPPFLQPLFKEPSQPKLQAKVEIHRNSLSNEELGEGTLVGNGNIDCQNTAPLASLKEEIDTTSFDGSRSSLSLEIGDTDPNVETYRQDCAEHSGSPYSGAGIALIDAPVPACEGIYLHVEPESFSIPNQEMNPANGGQLMQALTPDNTQDTDVDDMYYGLNDEPDHFVIAGQSDFEQ